MNQNKKLYTIGEVAKATGLTVRALQHYDNIGILPTTGRTDSGRRYYTESDILKLEQIVFYKSLGFKLQDIKEKMMDAPTPQALEKLLEGHLDILLHKITSLNMAVSIINVVLDETKSGKSLPWETMTQLIRTIEGSSLKDWTNYKFDSQLLDSPMMKDASVSGAVDIYLSIKSLLIEAAMLHNLGRGPEEPIAQALAKRWWELILHMTGGEETFVSAFTEVNNNREEWPEEDRALYQVAEPFMEEALGIYIAKNNITVPEALK
jgi:DNA-binding transcriptional MerR regulator